MNRQWDLIDVVIVAFYGFAGLAAAIAFYNGHDLLTVAITGFAVAGFGVTLAMVLAKLDNVARDYYNR
jgi:hypothetical protein